MLYRVTKASRELQGSITLPASKSESNRALVIQALSGGHRSNITNLSAARDTQTLAGILDDFHAGEGPKTYDVGPAGTAFRFLTAYFACCEGADVLLTGTDRMKKRPVKILAEALKQLGADIEYAGEQGFPPLRIRGKKLEGGTVGVDSSVSSQYITALLLIAPGLSGGLEIIRKGTLISDPYIHMTVEMMRSSGALVHRQDRSIRVEPALYRPGSYEVEGDWSSASYWFEAASLAASAAVHVKGLKEHSLQGDSAMKDIAGLIGLSCHYEDGGFRIRRISAPRSPFSYDFLRCPDIAQTLAAVCAGNNIPALFTGLQSLKIKETDRIEALVRELGRLNVSVNGGNDSLSIGMSQAAMPSGAVIETYEDHRMAMAFAPLALRTGTILIRDPQVVEKSYPGYWEDMKALGFSLEETHS
jgi:3-phosphoshikimate 1-carboxyvinyltransferase